MQTKLCWSLAAVAPLLFLAASGVVLAQSEEETHIRVKGAQTEQEEKRSGRKWSMGISLGVGYSYNPAGAFSCFCRSPDAPADFYDAVGIDASMRGWPQRFLRTHLTV